MSASDFLFGTQPGKGVYEMASYAQRRALSSEQLRFLMAVARYDPAAVLGADVVDTFDQFFNFRLSNFNYDADLKDTMDRTFPARFVARIDASPAGLGTMPTKALTAVFYLTFVASALYLALAWLGLLPGRLVSPALRRTLIWVVAGMVLNAAICGCISANEARYQARVVWVLPLMALCVEAYSRLGPKSVPSMVRDASCEAIPS